MTDIIDRPMKAAQLPPELGGDIDPAATMLVTVQRITESGMTEEQEAAILAAEAEFGLRLAAAATAGLETVGDLAAAIGQAA